MIVVDTSAWGAFFNGDSSPSALGLLARLPMLAPSFEPHVQSARLYRALRRKGVTIRGTVDCIIASVCIETGAPLLTLDRDFLRIAEHSALEVVRV